MQFSKEFVIAVSLGFIGINMSIEMFSYFSKYFKSRSSFREDCVLQIKEDLEDDKDELFFDAETGSVDQSINKNVPGSIFETYMNEIKLLEKQRFKSIEELYKYEERRNLSVELQLQRLEEFCLRSMTQQYNDTATQELSKTIEKLQKTVDEQRFIIAEKDNYYEENLKTLKLDMITIKNNLNTMITKMNDSIIQTTATSITERNTENSYSKIGLLKTRISILEREVTKNSLSIIEMNYSHRNMLSTRMNLETGDGVMLAENSFGRKPPNAHYYQPAMPTSSGLKSTGLSPENSISRPLPPPPSVTTDFGPPPPPPPPRMVMTDKMAPLREVKTTGASSSLVTGPETTSPKTYGRIPITEEILRSVVLKPPGQRKAGQQILTK